MSAMSLEAMTLEEALSKSAEHGLRVAFALNRVSVWNDEEEVSYGSIDEWPDLFSEALGRPVVERDPAQELRDAVREYLAAAADTVDHGESSSYTLDAAERLEQAHNNLRRLVGMEDSDA